MAELIEQYFAAYPEVERYLEANAAQAIETGMLRTPVGRIRRFGDASTITRKELNEVQRQAKNFVIQGACADGLKLALTLLYERRAECPGAVPILAVHDEIVIECDEEQVEAIEVWLKKAMIDGMTEALEEPGIQGSCVPVEVEVERGRSWAR